METIHRASNVDYRLLEWVYRRKREAVREIEGRGLAAYPLIGIGMAIMAGGLVIAFGILYVLNLLVHLIV